MKTTEFTFTKEMAKTIFQDLDNMTLKQINDFADTLKKINNKFDNFIKINIYKSKKFQAIETLKNEAWMLKEVYKYFGLAFGNAITTEMLEEFYDEYWSYCDEVGVY